MAARRGGLGRSLTALLQVNEGSSVESTSSEANNVQLLTLPRDALQPGKYQPRRAFDEAALGELAQSIQQQGLLQPLVVRVLYPGQYEIVAGERRWRACQLAGLEHIPVLVKQIDDKTAMAMALVENLQREALTSIDQARAMQRLTEEFSLTHQEIANLLSKSRTAVTNFLRLLHLNPVVQQKLEEGRLDMGHARCLLTLDEAKQAEVAEWVITKQLSVRETEALVARLNSNTPSKVHALGDHVNLFQAELHVLAQKLNTRVSIKAGKSGKGSLIIHYDNTKTLHQVIEQLNHPSQWV